MIIHDGLRVKVYPRLLLFILIILQLYASVYPVRELHWLRSILPQIIR